MNAFNRLVMLVVALLLVAIPVLVLLMNWGILQAEAVSPFYRGPLDALGGAVSNFDFGQGARAVIAAVGAVVALVAGFLLLRELTFGRPLAPRAVVESEPGRETTLTAQAVRSLAEGAAREAGASSPKCRLTSERGRYEVSCDIHVPRPRNLTETATRARENIRKVLEAQQVPVKDVEVTVRSIVS